MRATHVSRRHLGRRGCHLDLWGCQKPVYRCHVGLRAHHLDLWECQKHVYRHNLSLCGRHFRPLGMAEARLYSHHFFELCPESSLLSSSMPPSTAAEVSTIGTNLSQGTSQSEVDAPNLRAKSSYLMAIQTYRESG